MVHTVVNDYFFDDVDNIIKWTDSLEFLSPGENDNWPGERTRSLHTVDQGFFNHTILKILSHYYDVNKISYGNTFLYCHRIKPGDYGKTGYHIDNQPIPFKIASVIYLTDGDIDSGTSIVNENHEKQIVVANKTNTMVAYDAQKWHGPTTLEYNKERLTFVAFIGSVNLK